MADNKRENVAPVPSFSYQVEDSTTAKMERGHHYIDRGRLWLIQGVYTKENLERL